MNLLNFNHMLTVVNETIELTLFYKKGDISSTFLVKLLSTFKPTFLESSKYFNYSHMLFKILEVKLASNA